MRMPTFKPYHKIIYSILTAVLLYLSWPPRTYFTCFSFIALVPLLLVAESVVNKKTISFLYYTFLSFLIFNVLTIGWIYYSSFWGAFSTVVANAFVMMVPWLAFIYVYKRKKILGLISLLCFYLSFEYIHYKWDINFPWLNYGNLFADKITWVQWYEYTGVAGGSLWIMLVNVIIFWILIQKDLRWKQIRFRIATVIILIFLPILISKIIFYVEQNKLQKYLITHSPLEKNVLIIQPNYDAYTEKFNIPEYVQVEEFIKLIDEQIDSNTLYVLLPETALPQTFWEDNPLSSVGLNLLLKYLQNHKKTSIVLGATTYSEVDKNFNSPAKRVWHNGAKTIFYEIYNTSIILNSDSTVSYYHKSQLVPAAEKMPYAKYLSFLTNLMVDLGGVSGSLGQQDSVTIFYNNQYKNKYTLAVPICYESIFGGYMTEFINKGADIIAIITNDGWWEKTDGYQQHASYAQLRAIENRYYIYRSANTGISLVLNPLGQRIKSLDWDVRGVIKSQLYEYRTKKTFYTRYPYLIYKLSVLGTCLFFLSALKRRFTKPKKLNKK